MSSEVRFLLDKLKDKLNAVTLRMCKKNIQFYFFLFFFHFLSFHLATFMFEIFPRVEWMQPWLLKPYEKLNKWSEDMLN
jgi:hypothetical protein